MSDASPPTETGSFRKKPVVIQARRIASTSFDELQAAVAWIGDGKKAYHNGAAVYIYTAEGTMQALPGDWIIRGVQGEYYPCKPDIFAQTYESAEQSAEPGVSLPEPAATDATNISADAARQAADSLMAFARWQYTSEGSDYWVDAERRLRLYAAMRSPETKPDSRRWESKGLCGCTGEIVDGFRPPFCEHFYATELQQPANGRTQHE